MLGSKHPKYTLTQADLDSSLSERESAGAIGRRNGVTPSLVTYYLRKLGDPRVNTVLARNSNSNKAKHEFANEKRAKLDQMILSGASVSEIVVALRVPTSTVTRARKRLGLYVAPAPRKPKQESTGTVYDLLHDVVETATFKLLTKPWPVNLERTTGEAA